VARFARLLKQATDMMEGNQNAAIGWLKSPQVLLENQAPLEYARTESGAAEVQQLIGRIESGVYS
jgi:putative toxin-antitoxin system antitoxin component (TIGR02293 family)